MIFKVDPERLKGVAEGRRKHVQVKFDRFLIGAVGAGLLSRDEGAMWLRGFLPYLIASAIVEMPQERQFAALVECVRPDHVSRIGIITDALLVPQLEGPEAVDAFFVACSAV